MNAATLVLVHGAWHGGWCYARVAALLRSRGYRVETPTLTGLGERVHLANPDITLVTHITDVVNVIRFDDLQDVVLCGHSYGGMVISGVAEALAERIAALVYIDAFVPQNGQSLHDLVPEPMRDAQLAAARANGGFVPPIPAAHFAVNERDRVYVDAYCVPQPARTLSERIVLTGAADRIANNTYLRAADYRSQPFDAARARVAGMAGWVAGTITGGHDLMLDAPGELADALAAAAARR